MSTPPTTAPVCVTGASGFIASHIVRALLARGYRVRGTVRNPDRKADLRYLTDLPGAAERLELVAGDLQDARGWDVAVTGCEVVGIMRNAGVGGRLPRLSMDNAVGTSLVRLLSHFQPKGVGSYLRSHIGRVPAYDDGKIRRDLGIAFRPARTSVQDTIDDLRRRGRLPAA
jgi:uncharacterized protein YbjT (DUF2867 family)